MRPLKNPIAAQSYQSPDPYAVARRRMVETQLVPRGITDARVLKAMGEVLRHRFVAPGMEAQAYEDRPLSIGLGQTISQPHIVAYMLQALALKADDEVLEIGTGCGYQTALLARLVHRVHSVERIRELIFPARLRLKQLGYRNVHLKLGDGSLGWPEAAPFDAIVVSAAAPRLPEPYLEQLRVGGRLILPVGEESSQTLTFVEKSAGGVQQRTLLDCRFVPLKGSHGFA